jgi:hypothetical protein
MLNQIICLVGTSLHSQVVNTNAARLCDSDPSVQIKERNPFESTHSALEWANQHVLKESEVYKLHVTKENVHKFFID